MKAVTWHGKRDVRVDNVPNPSIQGPNDAIVRITTTNICGSDLHLYEVPGPFIDPGDILGHEPMGIVEGLSFLEYHVYLVALAGLAVFYGLERAAKLSRGNERRAGGDDATGAGVFWLHVGSFALYNALVGYLMPHREEPGLGASSCSPSP